MIKSFKHKGLEKFFYTGSKKGIRPDQLKDMNFPGSYLHQLSGNKEGQHSDRISGNWRIFFKFVGGDAYVVDYDNYY